MGEKERELQKSGYIKGGNRTESDIEGKLAFSQIIQGLVGLWFGKRKFALFLVSSTPEILSFLGNCRAEAANFPHKIEEKEKKTFAPSTKSDKLSSLHRIFFFCTNKISFFGEKALCMCSRWFFGATGKKAAAGHKYGIPFFAGRQAMHAGKIIPWDLGGFAKKRWHGCE